MKKLILHFILLTSLVAALSGCGTIISLSNGNKTPYAGVTKDFKAIENGGVLSILAVIDLPLSFVMDTLMLPVTLSE